jgi:hypothetical protein
VALSLPNPRPYLLGCHTFCIWVLKRAVPHSVQYSICKGSCCMVLWPHTRKVARHCGNTRVLLRWQCTFIDYVVGTTWGTVVDYADTAGGSRVPSCLPLEVQLTRSVSRQPPTKLLSVLVPRHHTGLGGLQRLLQRLPLPKHLGCSADDQNPRCMTACACTSAWPGHQ